MRPPTIALAAPASLLLGGSCPAFAADFDASGNLSFAPSAAWTQSFESWQPPDAGAQGAKVVEDGALHGGKALRLKLSDESFALELPLLLQRGTYRLSYWMKGDAIGGAAADYGDATPSSVAQAWPTGRATSDGWLEMRTEPFAIDGYALAPDLRVFMRAYDASQPVTVDVDALEVTREGDLAPAATCKGWPDSSCGKEAMCLRGVCHDARGWFPPLPEKATREALAAYWKQKIHDTFGPYLLRKQTMPAAIASLDALPEATTNVEFWSAFTRAIRMLSDAHTYTRSAFMSRIRGDRPFNGCFVEGKADLTQAAWPSDPAWPDVLVSHVGKELTWNLHAADRLVAIDGIHPLLWVKQLFPSSPWVWTADDPAQNANLLALLRSAISLHATNITVVRCDSNPGTCSATPEVIALADMPWVSPSAELELVGCDNRPAFHVAGAPDDHRFESGAEADATIVEGKLFESLAGENLRGLVWNTLYGGWPGAPVDDLLNKAVASWSTAGGVVQDHREGHGGTAATANILVGFSRETFVSMIGVMRVHANDEGPSTVEEGQQWFSSYKSLLGEKAGSSKPHADIPVALLLTWDVSASDFLPFELKGGKRVRLFGPGPTMGAFGTFYQYSYWGGLLWSLAAQDSISPEGVTMTGHGVIPDELILPTQSDLLKGRDTLHDAAVAWIRKEMAQ